MKNIKNEFSNWLLKSTHDSYRQYLGNSINSITERLTEIDNFFPELSFFELDESNPDILIQAILKILSKKERVKNPKFMEYDKFHSNGIPKAIMGKNNYIKFIEKKLTSGSDSENKKTIYTWVETYGQIVEYIADKQNDQVGLINLLKESGCEIFNDQNPEKTIFELNEIDPFTFFCYLNKYFKKRLNILQKLAEILKIKVPSDDLGIPSTNPQKVWLFPYKYYRNNNEIERLWQFFNSTIENNVSDQQFEDILKINGVGKTKITESLFYINPIEYFPINGPTKPYIEEVFGVSPIFNTYSEYLNVLDNIRKKTSKPFYELSYDSWLWSEKRKKTMPNLDILIDRYIHNCETTPWLHAELYKFEWAKWINKNADFDLLTDEQLLQVAIDSQKEKYTDSIGVQFIKQGARKKMSEYIGIEDIRYFREFKEGKKLNEIGFESRNMSFPIISCWLSSLFPEKIYPVSRTSFGDIGSKIFNAKLSISNIAFIEGMQSLYKIIDVKLKLNERYSTILKDNLQLDELTQLENNWAVQDFLLFLDRNPCTFKNTTLNTKTTNMNYNPLNQILFGPPGTGKTFNTINEALKIVDPIYFVENQNDRKKLTDRFKELLVKDADENKGQIAFCTFHQSFSYEDFVEGIKPKTTIENSVVYNVEPGVFKKLCQHANSNNSVIKVKNEGIMSWSPDTFRRASFYKLSLGNYLDPLDKPIYEYCRDNSYISIGFGGENDFTGLTESEIVQKAENLKLEITAAQQMNYFIHYLKKGNYVIISNGNKYVRALGKVTGDYEYEAESPIRYNHFRKVEWIFTDELIPIEEIYDRGLSQKTLYKIDESALKQDFFTNQGQDDSVLKESKIEEKNYVLIIDEINRGNVSSIFGELITLIEKDKRAGKPEELEVTLPYSKEPFKVPSNVYIIGTMNTADRSIEALDTALRRRFSFKEFPPQPNLTKTEGKSAKFHGIIDGIDLEVLLNTINTRIEKLLDKDHKIGHSYFLKVDSIEKLKHAFTNEIIPLLEEYFFGDYGKIGLVIGSSFVEKVNHNFEFANFQDYDTDIQSDLKEKAVFRIKNEDEWKFTEI